MENEDAKMQFAQRLIAAMQAQGYKVKASVLEREFNLRYSGKPITLQGVRKWLIGEAIPPADKLLTLAKWLNLPPEELAFDKDIQKAIQQREAHWQEEIGYRDKEIFDAFIKLPASQKKIVREVIVAFAKAYQTKDD
ncbi:DNA-binding protein [Acinetobacter populi]|jgi:transcriptional regulator with XRE-family HTH domain|uniref:DNA-binding protein n=1 Tax=Acinetobacter populi TaxID=1582270 RepID=A0A1Z9YUE8_9GAMM|nr:DNA-binding protein [Acinetobacter populi]MCH4246751.1 XRE family transcriptional regulator [Acinetobacter populi]OUY05803.1 DNA-binding protein [Acinetobacter populi]